MSIKPEKLVVARNLAKKLNETILDDCCDFPRLVHANAHLASTIIERLCFEIEQLEAAQPKWISVEERLPEKSGSYLVCTRRSCAFTAHFYLNTKEWKSHFAGSAGKHVTHWMPLPEAPKEETND